jgi:hypothetical protein
MEAQRVLYCWHQKEEKGSEVGLIFDGRGLQVYTSPARVYTYKIDYLEMAQL